MLTQPVAEGGAVDSPASAEGQTDPDSGWLLQKAREKRTELEKWKALENSIQTGQELEYKRAVNSLQIECKELESLLREVRTTNWAMVDAYFTARGVTIRPPDTVFALVVHEADQRQRLKVGFISLCVFLIFGLLVPVNPTTLHIFYRDQLSSIWISKDAKEFGRRIPLKYLDTCRAGGPYHVINCALNLFGGGGRRNGTGHFLFSNVFCGNDRIGYEPTGVFSEGEVDLANAVAISGGAVVPARVDNVLVRALLYVLNLRLGQWLPNPSNPPAGIYWPSLLGILISFLVRKPEERGYCFVSDGGHHENTGIAALLNRRCRVIVACDASEDADFEFLDFQRMHREAETKQGVRIRGLEKQEATPERDRLDLQPVVPESKQPQPTGKEVKRGFWKSDEPVRSDFAEAYHVIAKITYPDDDLSRAAGMGPSEEERCGYLIYIKPTLIGDEPAVVKNYTSSNKHFPHDSTLDQFYEEDQFWAYRALGDHMGEAVCEKVFENECDANEFLANWLHRMEEVSAPREAASGAKIERSLETLKSERAQTKERIDAAVALGRSGVVKEDVVKGLLSAAAEARRQKARRRKSDDERVVGQAAEDAIIRLGIQTTPWLQALGLKSRSFYKQLVAAEILESLFRIMRFEHAEDVGRHRKEVAPGRENNELIDSLLKLFEKGEKKAVRAAAGQALTEWLVWMQGAPNDALLEQIQKVSAKVDSSKVDWKMKDVAAEISAHSKRSQDA